MTATTTKTAIQNLTAHEIPAEIMAALERISFRLQYTLLKNVYYAVWDCDDLCGVFGDGDNACYEWFICTSTRDKPEGPVTGIQLETSNCGYGICGVALRDALNRCDPPDKQAEQSNTLLERFDRNGRVR